MYVSSFRNKRRFIGNGNDNADQNGQNTETGDFLYYNAVINGDGSNRFSLAPAQAFYSEVRSIPLLTDTTGWNMAVSRLTTIGATDNFPLLIPRYINPATYESIYSVGATVRITSGTSPLPDTTVNLGDAEITTNPTGSLGFWGSAATPTSYLNVPGYSLLDIMLGQAGVLFGLTNSVDGSNAISRVTLQLTPLGWMNSLADVQTMFDNACAVWNADPDNAYWRINVRILPVIGSDTFRLLISSPSDNANYIPNTPGWSGSTNTPVYVPAMVTRLTGFMAIRSGYSTSSGQLVQWSGINTLTFNGTAFYTGNFQVNLAGTYGGLNAVQYAAYPGMVGNLAQRNEWRYVQLGNPYAVPANVFPGTNATFQWSFRFGNFGSYVPSAFEFAIVYLPPGSTDVTSGTVLATQVINVTTTTTGPYPTTYASVTSGPFANPFVNASTNGLEGGLQRGSTLVAVLRQSSSFIGQDVPDTFFIQGPIGVEINPFVYTSTTGGTTTLFKAQRPIIFTPQNVAYPTWITSYDWFARQINKAYRLVENDLASQVQAAYGLVAGTDYGLRYQAPFLSYDAGSGLFSYTLRVLDGIAWNNAYQAYNANGVASYRYNLSNGDYVSVTPSSAGDGPLNISKYEEAWTFSMNTALAQLIPFSVSRNADNDSNAIDATALQLEWAGSVNKSLFIGNKAFSLSQEFVSTAAWNPFIGLAITSNSIPAQFETSGQTTITSGQAPVPQVGNTTNPILFDLDFSTTNAHSLIQGISFAPFIYRWVQMSGGPLSDIGFFVYLKTRDNTLVPWDVPAFGMIDIKFLFSQSRLGITA